MIIRNYKSDYCEDIAKLFYDTVHSINIKDYSYQQINAWADGNINLEKWNYSLLEHFTIVAETDKNVIVGFGDIDKTGYLDRLYVHKDFQRQGIASAICDKLEKAFNVNTITTHASITAVPFFSKRNFILLKEQQVERKGVILTNYIMEKKIL